MSRSISVTLSGIIALLGSLLMLLAGAAGAAAMAFGGNSAAAGRGAAGGPFFAFSLGFLLLVSLWGVGASIGIFFRANWARVSLIIFGTFLAIGCLSGSAAIFLLPTPSLTQSGGISFATVRVWIGIVYLLLAGLGIWWVFLFASNASHPLVQSDFFPRFTGNRMGLDLSRCLALRRSAVCRRRLTPSQPAFAFAGNLLLGLRSA